VLKRERRVIRFDLAGFGLTGPSPDGRYSPEADVRLVIAVLDKLGVTHCVLGGNSLGGAVAWRTALAEPERVDKLILVDAGGYPSQPTSMPIGVRLLRMPIPPALLEHTLPRFLVEQGLHNIYVDPSKVTQEQIERSIELTQREGNRRALLDRARQRKPNRMAGHIADLDGIRIDDVLQREPERTAEPGPRRRGTVTTAEQLVIFDDLGHAPEEEDPARSVAAVREFLGLAR
jgi:pimeloyl-ACP methyl ester carboxylesterase